jgi:hypothetical protein
MGEKGIVFLVRCEVSLYLVTTTIVLAVVVVVVVVAAAGAAFSVILGSTRTSWSGNGQSVLLFLLHTTAISMAHRWGAPVPPTLQALVMHPPIRIAILSRLLWPQRASWGIGVVDHRKRGAAQGSRCATHFRLYKEIADHSMPPTRRTLESVRALYCILISANSTPLPLSDNRNQRCDALSTRNHLLRCSRMLARSPSQPAHHCTGQQHCSLPATHAYITKATPNIANKYTDPTAQNSQNQVTQESHTTW